MPNINSSNRRTLNQQFALLLDLISEGEIEGLVNGHSSIYLNESPIAPLSQSAKVSHRSGTVTTNGTTTVQASTPLFQGINLSDGDRYIQIKNAAGASTLDSIHNINDTTITISSGAFAGSQELTNFNTIFGTEAKFKNIRIAGAGPDGAEYVGTIIEVVDSTTAVVSPPLSTQVSSGTSVSIDYFAKITSIVDNDTCTVATGGMRSVTETATVSPAKTSTTLYNYRNTSAAFRAGALHQSIPEFLGFSPTASFIAAGPTSDIQWASAYGGTASPTTINGSTYLSLTAAQKQEIDQVVLTMEFPAGLLYVQKDGGHHDAVAEFRVVLRYKKSASATSWTEQTIIGPTTPLSWPIEGYRGDDARRQNDGVIRGRTNGSFLHEFKVNLQQFQPLYDWEIDVYRTTPDNPDDYNNNFVTDNAVLTTRIRTIQANIFDKFSYPNSAYAAVTFNAEDFSNVPTRGYHIRGKKVKVPTNYITREEIDANNPLEQAAKYTRNVSTGVDTGTYQYWNGAFRGDPSLSSTHVNFRKVYTNNPAWIFYDILTNKDYGLGEFIQESDVDVFSLYEIARYCDELVPNGKGGSEPRFTCNVYFQTKQEAYKILKDLASTFRGMMYWIDGQITAVQDRPKEPVYTFTQGNVIDGLFSYESTGQRARINQVNVTWNDPDQLYKQDVITIDDIDDIIKRGKVMPKDVVAFGCTSEGQATRVARWHLLTSEFENEIVKFGTAINAGFLRPGDLIKIQDAKADNVEFSGRLSSTPSTTTSIKLDREIELQSGQSYNLYLIYPEPGTYLEEASATINSTNYVRGDLILLDNSGNPILTKEDAVNLYDENTNDKVQVSFSPNSRLEIQPISTAAGTDIETLTVSSPFSSAPNPGVIWAVSNVNEYQRVDAPVTYRILGITEDELTKYSIVASKYAPQKYDELEKQWAVYTPPYVPTPSQEEDVPSVTGLRIEVVPAVGAVEGTNSGALNALVSWNEPRASFTDSNGNSQNTKYRFIDFYEVQHNFYSAKSGPEAGTINVIPASRTSETYQNVGAGFYTVRVRVRNISGHVSPWTTITQLVTATQLPGFSFDRTLKTVRGGTLNSPVTFSDGVISISNSDYTFVSTTGLPYSVASATTAQSTVDFSSVSSGDTAYWLFDYSDSDDPWKVVQTHTDSTVQNTSSIPISYSYWKEYGASNNGLSIISGTVSTSSGSNQIVGSGTAFTSHFSVGDLIKISPVNTYAEVAGAEYLEVLSVESDTLIYTRTNATKTQASKYAYKQLFKTDFVNDNILAEVTNSGGNYFIEYYVIKSGEPGTDGVGAITIDINPLSVSVSSASDGSVEAADLTGTGFTIYAYEGDTQLIVDTIPAPYSPGSFRWTVTDPSTVTRSTAAPSGVYSIIRLPDNTPIGVQFEPLTDIADAEGTVTIPIEITVVRADGTEATFNRTQTISKSSVGADGNPGFRSVQGYLYYEKTVNPSTPPSAPDTVTYTPVYTFTTGKVSTDGTDISATDTATDVWTNAPNQKDATSDSIHYILRYYGTETQDDIDNTTGTIDLDFSGSAVTQEINFTGIVTFNSVDGTFGDGTTVINGDAIQTGSIESANFVDITPGDFASSGVRLDLDAGGTGSDYLLKAENFSLHEDGTTKIKGDIEATSLTLTGITIPKTDLDAGVQTSLNLADSASQVNKGLALLLNKDYNGNSTANSVGEAALVAVDKDGNPDLGVDGFFIWDGTQYTVDANLISSLYTYTTGVAGKKGFMAYDVSGSNFTVNSVSSPAAFVWKEGETWYYDNNSSAQSFTPSNSVVALGYLETGSADVILRGGLFGEAVHLTLASFPSDTIQSGTIGGTKVTPTKIYQGEGIFERNTTGFYLDSSGNFSLKDKLSFDQTSLFVDGNIEVESYIRAGSGANSAVMSGRDIDNFAFWAGKDFETDGGPSGGSAPFRVSRSGKVVMTNFALYSTNGTKLFDSEEGLSTLPQTVVADSSGTLVDIVSEELASAENSFTVTLSSTQTITANFAYPVGYLFYSGSSTQNALDNIPSSFTVTMLYSADGVNYSTFGSAQTFSRVTTGTATPSQFRVVANTFTIPPIIYGASSTTLNVAYLVEDEGALDPGYTLLGSTSAALGAGTYYFRMLISADQGSGTGALDTAKPREVRLSTSGAGFTVSGTTISDSVGSGNTATTAWVYDNFVEKGENENVTLGGDLTVTGNFTVNGTTTTINSTTLTVDDLNVVLASGAGSAAAANGAGITIDGANASLTYTSATNRFTFNKPIDFSSSFYGTAGPAIYLNNGDITGANSIVFEDPANAVQEGISWPRTGDANFDTVVSLDGTLYYYPNRAAATTSYTGASTVWHSGNDGSGSGLDADLLDGQQGSYYLNYTNLTNKPSATDVLTEIKTVDGSGSGLDADVLDGQQGSYYLDYTNFTNTPTATDVLNQIKTVDGSGSGLDADLLDGLGSSDFLRSNANDSFSGKLTATGTLTNTALDLATNDQYASLRVIRNEGGYSNDGMYIGYANAGTGTTKIYGGGSTTNKLEVGNGSATLDGTFTATNNITAYSDERLKTNIQTLDGSKVFEMRGVSFIKDGLVGSGVIAQELEKIAPELVVQGEYKSVAYGNLVGYLIEAVKDLKSEVNSLKELLQKNNED